MDKNELVAGLRGLGLKKNDHVLLHSSLASLGHVDGAADAVIDAFLEVLGAEGTLLVPVFGALGILTETLKKRPGSHVSDCPRGTVAALGGQAGFLCENHYQAKTVHGADTPYTRLADLGGYICLLGVDQDRNTTLHSVEALLELPYMGSTEATFTTPSGENVTKKWPFYPGPHRDFIGLDALLRANGMEVRRIGNAEVRLIPARMLFEVCIEAGRQDPAFVLCDNPACADCVRQRAALFADRIGHESFELAASSRLAGRYIPEMIENCRAAGIQSVEFDEIQGRPAASIAPAALERAAQELTEANISVSALRVMALPDEADKLIERVLAAKTKRVILPFGEGAENVLRSCTEAGLTVLFYNRSITARRAGEALAKLKGFADCSFCFNGANFAEVSEMPFLYSYRVGRFAAKMTQLDVCDALWSGEATTFARGNGEIKELLSILRCRNFSGMLTLGGGAVYPGTLQEAAEDFAWLLDTI